MSRTIFRWICGSGASQHRARKAEWCSCMYLLQYMWPVDLQAAMRFLLAVDVASLSARTVTLTTDVWCAVALSALNVQTLLDSVVIANWNWCRTVSRLFYAFEYKKRTDRSRSRYHEVEQMTNTQLCHCYLVNAHVIHRKYWSLSLSL